MSYEPLKISHIQQENMLVPPLGVNVMFITFIRMFLAGAQVNMNRL